MPSYIIVILGTLTKGAFVQQTPTTDILVGSDDEELNTLLNLWVGEHYKSELKPIVAVKDAVAATVDTTTTVTVDTTAPANVDTNKASKDTPHTLETISGFISIKPVECEQKRIEIIYHTGWWVKSTQTIAVVYKFSVPMYTKSHVDNLHQQNADLSSENQNIKDVVGRLEEEARQMAEAITQLESQVADMDILSTTIDGIEKVINDVTESKTASVRELNEQRGIVAQLQNDLHAAKLENATIVAENQYLIDKLSIADNKINSLTKEVVEVKEEHDQHKYEIMRELHVKYNEYINQMKETNKDLLSIHKDANTLLKSKYESQIASLNDKIAELTRQTTKPITFNRTGPINYDEVVSELKNFKLSSLRHVNKSYSADDLLEFETVDRIVDYENPIQLTYSEQTYRPSCTLNDHPTYTFNPNLFRQISPKSLGYYADNSSNCSDCSSCSGSDEQVN